VSTFHILQFDQYLKNELAGDDGKTFCLLTDGQLHVRQCLHPQSTSKGVPLPEYFFNFFDLRKEFRKRYPDAPHITDVKDMANYLRIDVGNYNFTETGLDECKTMASIVQRLIADNHLFMKPDYVTKKYEPGTYDKTDSVPDDTVVKARGLPWQASDRDVFRFFKGLNIARGGVALCLNTHGRRNGEVMVHFESSEQRDMALQRHKHNLGKRYVEVFKATGDEFIRVAAGTSKEATLFLARDEGHIIVRMRGLPFTANEKDVVDFFGNEIPVAGSEEGILFVKQKNGKMTGDAFVLFASEDAVSKALAKHREYLGNRYIEIFRSTTAEVQQVLSRVQSEPIMAEIPQQPVLPPVIPIPMPLPPPPQHFITAGVVRDCIRMRGLPYNASIEDIMCFLGECAQYIRPHGVHMVLNVQGKPNGEAFIQMTSADRACLAAQTCHMKYMRERYVEVFQCSGEEMQLVLTSGIRNEKAPQPQVNAISPTTPLAYQHPHHPHAQLHHPSQLPQVSAGTIIPTMPHLTAHPANATHHTQHHLPPGATFLHQQQLVYLPSGFPSPPVSPTGHHLYYPGTAAGSVAQSNAMIRLRGLHTGATAHDVAKFFQGYGVPPDSVQNDSKEKAMVPFTSQDIAVRALQDRQRQFAGKMELFVA
ncbi:LOW QUALITY PROTEIN: epithelial splicing regulatory protein 1-like, partial [Diadema antillarum]|uniref:LOW QUALITY PROTEIN: epithelial splicing regulatory protein 1-like n=1 Tax=Diadema antillarum TaxID=105358 RepID=UPI003A857338